MSMNGIEGGKRTERETDQVNHTNKNRDGLDR